MFSQKSKRLVVSLQIAILLTFFPGFSIAQAGNSTEITFVINPYAGGLTINAPGTGIFAPMTSPETVAVASLMLETVTVTDQRRNNLGNAPGTARSWVTSILATNLGNGIDTLTANTFGYSSGENIQTGTVVAVTENTRTNLSTVVAVESASSATGNHVVTWRPTLTVPVPAFQASGSYSGSITHSVS